MRRLIGFRETHEAGERGWTRIEPQQAIFPSHRARSAFGSSSFFWVALAWASSERAWHGALPDVEAGIEEHERYFLILSNLDFIGLACTALFALLGAFVAARLAGSRGVAHGAAAAVVSLGLNAALGPASLVRVLGFVAELARPAG